MIGYLGKKSQTELLGFAIVVLLISVGMLFVIGFYVLGDKDDVRLTYIYKQLSTNMNDAILETTTGCRQMTARELLLSCVEYSNSMICPALDGSNPTIEDVPSCDYLSLFVEERLNQTLKKWGYYYEYSVRQTSLKGPLLFTPTIKYPASIPLGCKKQRSPLPLAGSSTPIYIYLDMYACPSKTN